MKKNNSKLNKTEPAKNKYVFIILILFLTIVTFSTAFKNGFVSFDDTGYITNNNLLKDISSNGLKEIFTTYVMGNYHPLVVLCDAVIYNFAQLNPMPYHAFSIFLHLVNTFLVFVFIKFFTKRNISAALAAGIFAVHPLHVENVAWVSDLKDLLYTFFYLAAMIFYIKYIRNQTQVSSIKTQDNQIIKNKTQDSVSNTLNYIFCFAMFILSLLSKSAAVTLPVVLFLFDYYFGRKLSLKSIGEKIPLFILSVGFGILNFISQAVAGATSLPPFVQKIVTIVTLGQVNISSKIAVGTNVGNLDFNIADRFFMVCYSMFYYIYSFILPVHLSNLHPFPVKINNMLPMIYYISLLFLLIIFGGLIWLIIRSIKHKKELITGTLFFIFTIFLILQFSPFGFAIVSERYTYLPYVGILLVLVKYYDVIYDTKKHLRINVNIGIVLVMMIFASLSFERNKDWKTSTSLLVDLTEKYPKFAMAFDDLGVARMLGSDLEGAILEFNKALEIDPNYYYSYNNRGEARRYLNNQEGAWQDYNRAIQLYPRYSDAYNNRAIIKFNRGDYIGSIIDCSMSIYLKPDNPNAFNNRASSRISLKDYTGAFHDYDSALKLNPYYADGYKNRGIAKYYSSDIKGACEDWKKAYDLGNTQASQLIQQYCK